MNRTLTTLSLLGLCIASASAAQAQSVPRSGGLQFRALHKDLVESGKLTNRAFHDAVLKENRIPVEMVRALLSGQPLTRDFKSSWKFYGPNPGAR